jgi:putative DNA primase/helicase
LPATRRHAKALGGRKVGGGWTVRCPAHHDREPSLSIREADDSKVLVHCHGGCEQERVIAALRSRGLWEQNAQRRLTHPVLHVAANDRPDRDDAKRTEIALAVWQSATPADGTLVETYLLSRGLHIPPPPRLRFHAGLKHPSGGIWPAMVALVTRGTDDTPLAIHRTFLARDGGRKAPVVPVKMMLGPCRGGAVRLGTTQPDQWLVIGEGIETTLSVMQACPFASWAALSEGGMRNLMLPPEAAMVLICADNDTKGTGQRAAHDAAERFLREGRRVRITMPPLPGTDFNNVLSPAAPAHFDEEGRDVA